MYLFIIFMCNKYACNFVCIKPSNKFFKYVYVLKNLGHPVYKKMFANVFFKAFIRHLLKTF